MKISRAIKYKVLLAATVIVLSVALSGVITLSKSVETQSLLEQQSLTPALNLVTEEIIKPLYVAETISRASPLKLRMSEDTIDEAKVLAKLASISKEFDMDFFVASETSRKQYNSNGTTQLLSEGKVEWYFRAKDVPQKIVGALGNREDIRIYYDIKIFDKDNQFLGFIGVSRRLTSFLAAFDNFKQKFGYDFVFVDHNDHVVLSSDSSLVADGNRILSLQNLPWHQAWSNSPEAMQSQENALIEVDGNDLLIAKANLDVLNWKLFLVNPLATRQEAANSQFLLQTINIIFLITLALLIGRIIVTYLQGEFAKKHQTDPLTQLPNRASFDWHFKAVNRDKVGKSVVMIDIDHFKAINDSYGHPIGDKVLREVARLLESQLREDDILARWGGEEFVLLLPRAKLSTACEVAERARVTLENYGFRTSDGLINITASFGIANGGPSENQESLIARADEALYRAKREGRNMFRVASPVTIDRPAELLSVI